MVGTSRMLVILVCLGCCGISLLLGGCLKQIPSPYRPYPGPQKEPQCFDLAEAFDVVTKNYRLGPDDVLRVLYQTEWNIPFGSYKLDTLDRLRIEFFLDPQLNKEVVIRPDGMITLSGVGDVRAAGLAPVELSDRIAKKYINAGIFGPLDRDETRKDYRLVTVEVMTFYEKIGRLVESLTTLVGGSQTEVVVKPDGTIDLPLLKDRILAGNYTLEQVEALANRLYNRKVFRHVIVSMSLFRANSRKVYVLGQVRNPGAYDIRQPISALHALSLAGGHITNTADLTSVILISKNLAGKPIGRRLDLKKILDVGDMSQAILVKPYDVLFVPKTYVADVRVFMDQYFSTLAELGEFAGTLAETRFFIQQ